MHATMYFPVLGREITLATLLPTPIIISLVYTYTLVSRCLVSINK